MKILLIINALSFFCGYAAEKQEYSTQSLKIALYELNEKNSQEIKECILKRMNFICGTDKLSYRLEKKEMIIDIPSSFLLEKEELIKYILNNFSFNLNQVCVEKTEKDIKYVSFIPLNGVPEILVIIKKSTINTEDVDNISYNPKNGSLTIALNEEGERKIVTLMNSIKLVDRVFVNIDNQLFFAPVILTKSIRKYLSIELKANVGAFLEMQYKYPLPLLIENDNEKREAQ